MTIVTTADRPVRPPRQRATQRQYHHIHHQRQCRHLGRTLPTDLATTLATCVHAHNCLMYSMGGSGMGAQTLNIFATKLFAEQVYNRTTFLVDETAYDKYARSDGTLLLRAYFTTQFALVERYDQYTLVDDLLPGDWTMTKWQTETDRAARQSLAQQALPGINNNNNNNNNNDTTDLVIGGVHTFHKFIKKHYRDARELYTQIIPHICPSMQFNDRTWKEIQGIRQQYSFESLRRQESTSSSSSSPSSSSVAFHVRRTDKIIKESRLYTAKEYVDKLVSVLQANNVQLSNVDVCFVATDDASVVPEMQSALEATQLSCRLVYTPTANITGKGDRYRPNSTLIFLAELSMLVEATYFVGTFNSNVGELAAVLRACPGGYPAENHFAQSYGVDQEDWMLH